MTIGKVWPEDRRWLWMLRARRCCLVGDPIGDVQRGHEWTRQFVAETEKPSAPLLHQSDNGTHERKAV